MSDVAGGASAPRVPSETGPRRSVLLPTLVTLGVLLLALAVFTGVWTDKLWFDSVSYPDVFTKVLFTRAGLFVVGALLLAGSAALNIVLAYRWRPFARAASARNEALDRWRTSIDPVRGRLLVVVIGVLGILAGSVAAGQWQSFMLWQNRVEFGQNDLYFDRDIGYYVFEYPWIRFATSFLFVTLAVSIIAAAITHYLYGGIDLQARRGRLTESAQAHLSVLVGLFVLLKAWAYYLDRFAFAIGDGGLFTGIQYTDANARIPAKNILIVIAILCALLLLANAVRRNWLLPGLGVGLLVLSSILLSGVWPAIMQQFQVDPTAADRESPFIALNIESTRAAYGVSEVQETGYDATTEVTPADLSSQNEALPNTRLLDPNLVSPAFTQLQQVRGYYSVPQTLDVDRYAFDQGSQPQDVVVAAREVNLDGLDESQRNWTNDHTVYTHGLGLIAAYGDRRGDEGQPDFAEAQIPPQGAISALSAEQSGGETYEPRIYFGENTPEYSVVGAPEGSEPVEVDIPTSEVDSSDTTLTTYEGDGGVPIGGLLNQTLYALKFGEPNLVLSGRVNEESKILYDRDPRERVEQVAPWLTVDGNAYPAVVGEQLLWIVDGYTTSNSYPLSDRVDLDAATADTNTEVGSTAALPSDQINYLRNSVKATVDAYTGEVTLYAWDESDPILQTWQNAFPDAVQPSDAISEELLGHLRYPEDLFKVQREILQTYHVQDPLAFYSGEERWEVPSDPVDQAENALQPPYYLSVQMPAIDDEGQIDSEAAPGPPTFALTSVYVPLNRENLAAFVSVDSDPTSDTYGEITLLAEQSARVAGPEQINNQFQADQSVSDALLSFRQAGVTELYGNLLTVPAGGGLLYVQPIYTQRESATGTGTYPQLRFVLASFGSNVGIGATLDEALASVLGEETGIEPPPTDPTDPPPTDPTDPPPTDPTDPPPSGTDDITEVLADAAATYDDAQAALEAGELGEYQDLVEEYNELVERAEALLEEPPDSGTEPPAEEDEGENTGG